MEYLLDTDICVFFLRGKFNLNHKISKIGIDNCFVSEITILELIYGARNSDNYEEHLEDVDKIKELFEVVPIQGSFERFAEEKVKLKKAGQLVPDFDLLIGTTSTALGMTMVTNNQKHLERIEGIKLENWTKSELNEFIEMR